MHRKQKPFQFQALKSSSPTLAEEWILQHITLTVLPEMNDLTDDYNLNQNTAGLA